MRICIPGHGVFTYDCSLYPRLGLIAISNQPVSMPATSFWHTRSSSSRMLPGRISFLTGQAKSACQRRWTWSLAATGLNYGRDVWNAVPFRLDRWRHRLDGSYCFSGFRLGGVSISCHRIRAKAAHRHFGFTDSADRLHVDRDLPVHHHVVVVLRSSRLE